MGVHEGLERYSVIEALESRDVGSLTQRGCRLPCFCFGIFVRRRKRTEKGEEWMKEVVGGDGARTSLEQMLLEGETDFISK